PRSDVQRGWPTERRSSSKGRDDERQPLRLRRRRQEWSAHSATDFAGNDADLCPRPEPQLIATYKTKGEALAVSKALDRDRAVDESGNQVAVFGRRGARPFTFEEVQRMLKTNGGAGDYFTVSDEPLTQPRTFASASASHPQSWIAALLGFLIATACYGARKLRTKNSRDLKSANPRFSIETFRREKPY